MRLPNRTTMLTRMTSQRPDRASTSRLIVSTIFKGRDFWGAVVVGVVVFVALRGAGTVDGATLLVGLGAVSATLTAGSWLAERWLADQLHGSDYGELVSVVDPDLRAALMPFGVIISVGVLATVSSFVAASVVGSLGPGIIRALVYAVPSWLSAWTVFGTAGLTLLTRRHLRRRNRLMARRREIERERRLRDQGNGAP